MNSAYNSIYGMISNGATRFTPKTTAHSDITEDKAKRVSSAVKANSHLLNTKDNIITGNKEISSNKLIRNNKAIDGFSDSSSLVNQLDNALNFSNDYLIRQKLQNTNTYNRLKSNIVFQSEFLAHVRLNSLT